MTSLPSTRGSATVTNPDIAGPSVSGVFPAHTVVPGGQSSLLEPFSDWGGETTMIPASTLPPAARIGGALGRRTLLTNFREAEKGLFLPSGQGGGVGNGISLTPGLRCGSAHVCRRLPPRGDLVSNNVSRARNWLPDG